MVIDPKLSVALLSLDGDRHLYGYVREALATFRPTTLSDTTGKSAIQRAAAVAHEFTHLVIVLGADAEGLSAPAGHFAAAMLAVRGPGGVVVIGPGADPDAIPAGLTMPVDSAGMFGANESERLRNFLLTPMERPEPVTGVRRVLTGEDLPPRNVRAFKRLLETSEDVVLSGTSLTDLRHAIESDRERILKNHVLTECGKIEILLLSPEFEPYLSLRAREIDEPGFKTKEKLTQQIQFFETLKADLAAEAAKEGRDVEGRLEVGLYEAIPRAAILKFDSEIYVRYYSAFHRGGNAQFGFQVQSETPVGKLFQEELDRRRSAVTRWL